jgi:RND family efflux transporter MFP subunit
MTVCLTAPKTENWLLVLLANGNVVAWQEVVIGAEIANYRITEVRVQVGDVVKKGQVLARISSDTVASELAEAKASVAELEASAAEAKSNAERAKELKEKGFYSSQLNSQYQTAEHTALARLAAARARLLAAGLRMDKTDVLAPDDGVISARSATVGSLTQPGQELFRLIRGGRLEWRAEVPSSELAGSRPGGGEPATERQRQERCGRWRPASIRKPATGWSMSICRCRAPSAPACSRAANSSWRKARR